MKFFYTITLSVLALGIQSCDDPDAYNDPSTGQQSGEIIYQKECFLCHGEYGDQGASGAANLRTSLLDEDEMSEIVKKGSGDMQAFSHLTDEQVALVVKYIRTDLKKKVK